MKTTRKSPGRQQGEEISPTGLANLETPDDSDVLRGEDPFDGYDDFADPGDSHPDDRRRDPLRH